MHLRSQTLKREKPLSDGGGTPQRPTSDRVVQLEYLISIREDFPNTAEEFLDCGRRVPQ